MINTEPISGLSELDLDNLALLNDRRADSAPVALTAEDDIAAYPAWLYGQAPGNSGKLENATACIVIVAESDQDPRDIDAFYFYFYPYNRGINITSVMPPFRGAVGKQG